MLVFNVHVAFMQTSVYLNAHRIITVLNIVFTKATVFSILISSPTFKFQTGSGTISFHIYNIKI